MPNPVGWFEIPTKDIVRAKKFYETSFGYSMTFQEEGPYKMALFPMESGAPRAAGSLTQHKDYVPSYQGTLVYFSVSDIEETLKKIEKNGGKKLSEKISIGENGFIGIFEDTEGNRVALHSIK